MLYGILAGVTWALETVILGAALRMGALVSTRQALLLAPFAAAFLHDFCSAVFMCVFNGVRGKLPQVGRTLKTRGGRFVALAAVIGGPVGMTGYALCVSNLGASVGAVASAVYPAIGAALAYFFLKEKMQWYRWLFLLLSLGGVYALSYAPQTEVRHFWLGLAGMLMCAFGWGIEAVLIARCVRGGDVAHDVALQIRQTTSALVHGAVVLPIVKGWSFTASLLHGNWKLPGVIALAALAATASYLCYYRSIAKIGAAKSMALNITYCAWAVVFSVVLFGKRELLEPVTILCTAAVLCFGILAGADLGDLFARKKAGS